MMNSALSDRRWVPIQFDAERVYSVADIGRKYAILVLSSPGSSRPGGLLGCTAAAGGASLFGAGTGLPRQRSVGRSRFAFARILLSLLHGPFFRHNSLPALVKQFPFRNEMKGTWT